MNRDTVDILNRLNASFYRNNCESFDRTRQTGWPGWNRVVTHIRNSHRRGRLTLVDIACGNMRFEKYLAESLPDLDLSATCIDSCDGLAAPLDFCTYRSIDIILELSAGGTLPLLPGSPFDVAVSFGFFHHIPGIELRERMIDSLVETVRPGGLVALSLWRFADDDKVRAKTLRTTEQALEYFQHPPEEPVEPKGDTPFWALREDMLEEGDYLLGWNDLPGAYRYCHSFASGEIDALVGHVSPRATLVDRFRADGRADNSNEYLLFRRND